MRWNTHAEVHTAPERGWFVSAVAVDHHGEPPAVNRLTPSFVAEIRWSSNRLSGHARGSAEPFLRRRASVAAGSDAHAVVEVILNDMLAGYRPLKRGTLADCALMRGVPRIAGQRGLAKRQAGSVDDVIIAPRVP
jgi:hypothetical protein